MKQATPADVFATKTRLEDRDGALQKGYDRTYEALGLKYSENLNYAYYEEAQQREKLWWEKRTGDEANKDLTVKINLLHQIVEAQRTVLGANRNVRVPAMSESDEDQAYADALEKGIRWLHRQWVMPRQTSIAGWFASTLGSAVASLFWSDEKKHPALRIDSPKGFYADATLDDPTTLSIAMFVRKVTGASLCSEYPELWEEYGDVEEVELVDYYDRQVRMRLIVGRDEPLLEAKNTIGRVPVFILPGILMPGIYGGSAMPLAIPIHNELQRLYSLEAEVLQQAVRAPTVVNDPINVPENWVWGDEATIEVGPNGKVGKAVLDNIDHNLFFHRIQDMRRSLDDVMDFAAMSRGSFEGSTLTGKGVQNLLLPNSLRLEHRLQAIDPIWERVNETALLMWNKLGRNKDVALDVRKGKEVSVVHFNPKTSIKKGWVVNHVWLDSASMFDRQSNMVQILQALRAPAPHQQAISQKRAIELLPFTEDTMGEVQTIWTEFQKSNSAMQAATAPPQATAGGPSAEEEALAAEKGAIPPGASGAQGSGPGGPLPEEPLEPGMMPAPTPGVPPVEAEALEDAANVIHEIPKVKGRIFLVGAVLEGRLDLGIEIWLTDMNDKATIVNAFANDPILEVIPGNDDLHFRGDAPAGDVVEVTPGKPLDLTPRPAEEVEQELAAEAEGQPQSAIPLTSPMSGPPSGAGPLPEAGAPISPDMMQGI